MKIQDLAIIFVIIILPISIVLSAYAQYQIQTINTQTLYDTKLTAATYDAIKAYQLNAENNSRSELANSKIKDIEASVATFRNSIMNTFRLNGYTEEQLDSYIPALVYTMYDGFYIYSPYTNTNYQYEPIKDDEGNITGYDQTKPLQDNGSDIYGLKPYIPYSCRYIKGDIDVVITYALENFITVRGTVNGEYVNESGYLVDGVSDEGKRYNEVTIETEQLREYLPIPRADSGPAGENEIPSAYPYIKLNGTKYYRVDRYADILGDDSIIYIANGEVIEQCKLPKESDFASNVEYKNSSAYLRYKAYSDLIDNNYSAIQYYNDAAKFTFKVRNELNLSGLTYADAYDIDGISIWPGNTTPIFDSSINIENELSNFNQHRLAVIRHTIENNLAIAIANYNNYSNSPTNDFQMPKLKEDEWDYITHNISLISFLQGLHIGGKVYNGYTIVTNSESEEVVLEPNIYMLGDDGNYHRIGDKTIEDGGTTSVGNLTETTYGATKSAGRLNLDFRRKTLTNGTSSTYYYPLHEYNASYDSVIMRENVTTYQDIYEYINDGTKIPDDYKQAFYIALGRERAGKYNSTITIDSSGIIGGSMETPDVGGTPGGGGTPTECTVKFWVDESLVESKTVSYGDSVTMPAAPTKDGWQFEGWSDGTRFYHPEEQSNNVYNDTSFTAKWNQLYTIEYNANGGEFGGTFAPGTTIITEQVPYAGPITSEEPSRIGYKFLGWATSSTATAPYYEKGDAYLGIEDTYLYAVWEAIESTITYNANGGIFLSGSTTMEETILSGGSITSEVPTRTGYKFLGWSTSSSATTATYTIGATYIGTTDITLYAVWEAIGCIITYNANGGTFSTGSETMQEEMLSGGSITSEVPTRTGYKFLGWDTNSESATATYISGATYTGTTDITLYAVWEAAQYIITYNANGGTFSSGSTTMQGTVAYGAKLTSTQPSRTGYKFLGWSTDSSAITATYTSGARYTGTTDITLYAVWVEVETYTVTYSVGAMAYSGVNAPDPVTVDAGQSVTLPTITTTTTGYYNYTFKGWSTSSSYGATVEYEAGTEYTPTSDITLYAVWGYGTSTDTGTDTTTTYTVTYSVGAMAYNGVNAPDPVTVDAGQSVTLPTITTTTIGYYNYTFKGWSTSSSYGATVEYEAGTEYTPTSDITLYAIWGY